MDKKRVVYLKPVTLPEHLAGETGAERELYVWDADNLIGQGYCRAVEVTPPGSTPSKPRRTAADPPAS